jgi:hypothetical protein
MNIDKNQKFQFIFRPHEFTDFVFAMKDVKKITPNTFTLSDVTFSDGHPWVADNSRALIPDLKERDGILAKEIIVEFSNGDKYRWPSGSMVTAQVSVSNNMYYIVPQVKPTKLATAGVPANNAMQRMRNAVARSANGIVSDAAETRSVPVVSSSGCGWFGCGKRVGGTRRYKRQNRKHRTRKHRH